MKNDKYQCSFNKIALLFIILPVVLLVRILAIEIYQVSSHSMEETFFEDDVVLVNKLVYGPRLPQKPGDVPFMEAVAFVFGKAEVTRDITWPYRRLPGYGRVKLNDVVVFEHPAPWSHDLLIKRCLALPGDTLAIRGNVRRVNGVEQNEPETVKYSYCVYGQEGLLSEDSLKAYGIGPEDFLWKSDTSLHYSMTMNEAKKLPAGSVIDSVVIDNFPKGAPGPPLFPHPSFGYTRENYGPVVVPAKGQTIPLDTTNIAFYHDAIARHEGNQIEVKEGRIIINGKETDHYTFKLDYYFMAGDNRYHSEDSRYWGFVPEYCVVGRIVSLGF